MDLGPLGLDRGGHLLVDRALAGMAPGQRLRVRGADPHLGLHLPVWARSRGHAIVDGSVVVAGDAVAPGLASAERAGSPAMVADVASPSWGLAARGALVEAGGPALEVADLHTRDVWSDLAPKLYAQAAAGQWDPATAVDWSPPDLPDEVEAAVVQVMTYLVENEQAALMVPARFLGRMNPHFREAIGFLATQIADEARHVAVFSRRATLTGRSLGISGTGGRASLQTLLDEPEWANASFLLSVLGEGTFLSLLAFLDRHGPDPVTAGIAHLVLQDEARHVAFALGHLGEHVTRDPGCRHRLRAAIERRHDALAQTAGLAPAVHDSLVLLAAGSWEPGAIAVGWDRVQALRSEMGEGRTRRLVRLGFTEVEASQLAALHAESFM